VDLELSGRACIVTGATRGIGLATARALCAEGARVLVIGRDLGRAERAASDAASAGGEAVALELDVTAPDAGEVALAACRDSFGGVDVLVNNAGTSRHIPLEELRDADWQAQLDLHVMASLRMMRAAVPAMVERGWGRVVNVCSSSGKRPSLSNAAYSVSKAAQLSLSRVFADTYASKGVLVNAVAPGPVESPLWMGEGGLADQAAERQGVSRDEALEAARSKIPLLRFGGEHEVAAVIVFLCSARASDVVGAAWSVDGGTVQTIV
jgi:3-oxoacyl-[acyl-carrier protein] reductase